MDQISPEAHGWSILQKLNEQKSMGLFCDVSLMVEGKIFLAHKNVLSACSEYFYAALSRNEQQQFLVLDNVCLEGFSHLLDFIYSYKIPSCHVQDFMQAAQVLQVSLPLTIEVVNVSSSPHTNAPKEEICIPDEDYDVPDQNLEIREIESQQLKRNRDDNISGVNSSIYSEERRRFETVSQLKDKAKMFKKPTFYKDSFAIRNPNYFISKQIGKSARMGRGNPEEPRESSFHNPAFARQMPITIHNDGSSEEADDEAADICINLCDEQDTPDILASHTINDMRMQKETVKPKIYSTIVGLQGGGVLERVDSEERHSEVVHKCDRCDLLLTYSEYLNHQDDPGVNLLHCNFCEKQFNYSCQLALHQSSHLDKKFYQCEQCGKELSTLKKLHDHIAYHSDARPHKCRLCDKAYKVKKIGRQHWEKRLGDRVQALEDDGEVAEQQWSECHTTQNLHVEAILYLQKRLEDVDNRGRRNNLRVTGILESMEGTTEDPMQVLTRSSLGLWTQPLSLTKPTEQPGLETCRKISLAILYVISISHIHIHFPLKEEIYRRGPSNQ
ncbi:zinc finger and BTB domain-containing 49-like [Pelobates cultripes]|uniref:Zinc finger and BTB domain-containing 49-like n=1 Tax=Pelobates cultripes TaxID=61616 RepID=A0AAD1W982_PELCU|nr:zinc finger and BTB domain-containing 49-like [Pelobates cultripes]